MATPAAPHTASPQPTRPAPQAPQPGLQGPLRSEPRPVATEPGRPSVSVPSRPQHVTSGSEHPRTPALAPYAIQSPRTDTPRESKIQTVDFNAALSSYTTGNWQARESSTVDPLHTQSWVSDFVRDDTANQNHSGSGDITGVLGASGNDYNAGKMRADINRLGEAIVTGKGPLILFTLLGAGVIIYVTREFATSGNGNSSHKHHDQ